MKTQYALATIFALTAPAAALLPERMSAQATATTGFVVAGRVVDAASGSPIGGAIIRVRGGAQGTSTMSGADGHFQLTVPQPAILVAEHAGYAGSERSVATSDTTLLFALAALAARPQRDSAAQALEGLTITAVRAGNDAPIAQTTFSRARLQRDYAGQDLPLTIRQAPSATAYSESGSLFNYSYFRLRGVDQSRINITLDGVPLNEPEDQQIYFSDFPDFTSSIESMQVQRGVGTSSYGQAAFGGSVNFTSPSLAGSRRGAMLQLGGGSFGTARGTLEAQSGQLASGLAVYGRVSGLRSDGYREGASTASNSAFVSGGYFGDRNLLKITAATGLERNGQAYAAVPDDVLRVDPRANPLAGVGDHYRESLSTVNYTRLLSPNASIGLTGYGFLTNGYYDYPSGGPERALRYRSSSRWVGLVAATHATHGRLTVDGGAHAATYSKEHEFRERADLQYPGYLNTGYKTEASAFGKASLALGMTTLFGDLQVRTAQFRYAPTSGYGLSEASHRWSFVNPKVGMTLRASRQLSLFASYGTTGREPTRSDLLAGSDDVTPDDAPALLPMNRVRPERVNDFEAGASLASGPLAVTVNVYDMRFRDEIARTGATTPLGYDLRANVGRSYRRGVELDGSWSVMPSVDLGISAAVSRNRIRAYHDEASGATYRDVAPILTPAFITSHHLTWRATSRVSLSADGRFQSRTFLAPTGNSNLTTPPFYIVDGGALLTLGGRSLLVQGRNLLNRRAYPSGDVSSSGIPRYFILAPRSADITLRIPF